jgi:hypothetical protein
MPPDETTSAPEREWPAHFPDGCPDANTPDCDSGVFRLIRNANDWMSASERERYPDEPECLRASLSCYIDYDHTVRMRAIMKGRYGSAVMVRADLTPSHGKMMATRGLGHYSVWLRAKYLENCEQLFRAVE